MTADVSGPISIRRAWLTILYNRWQFESLNIIWQQTTSLPVSQGILATNCCESDVYSATFQLQIFLNQHAELHATRDANTYLNKRPKVNLEYISPWVRETTLESRDPHFFLRISGWLMLTLRYFHIDQIIEFQFTLLGNFSKHERIINFIINIWHWKWLYP